MKNKIIEIVEIGLPKSLIQRENEPITELIETNLLVEELNEALRLFAVVGRSEQLPCDYCEETKPLKYCQDCWEKLEQFKQCY
jgi:hypothetical protein